MELTPGAARGPVSSGRRFEDVRLVTGAGRFVADLVPEDTLHCAFVRSPLAHGVVGGVDSAAVDSLAGVVAVLTADDMPVPDLSAVAVSHQDMSQPVLAANRVRFVGEPVAAVVAASASVAEDAAELIYVDIDPLPAVVDVDSALRDEVLLYPELGTNMVIIETESFGDQPDLGDLVEVTVEVESPRLAPSPIEPLSCLAVPEGDRLHIYVGHQSPHQLRDELAVLLGKDPESVHVTVPDVGGAFGMKRIYPEYVVVAVAALRLGKPVAWVQRRREMFAIGSHGRDQHHRVALLATEDGRINSARFELTADPGAYPARGMLVATLARFVATGLYEIPHVEFTSRAAVTNKPPTAPYRGAGRPEAALAIERAVDVLARELALDPAEVRRRNFVKTLPHTTVIGAELDSGDYGAALERALELIDYEGLRREQEHRRQTHGKPIGVGIGAFLERSGGSPNSGEHAAIEVGTDGVVVAETGSVSTGQGHETVWRRLVAAIFAVDPDDVLYIAADTDAVSRGVGTFGSRSVQVGAAGLWEVGTRLVWRATRIAADMLEASSDDVELVRPGTFHVVGSAVAGVTLAEVAARAQDMGEPLAEQEFYVPGGQAFPYGVHVAVIEVDVEVGEVKLVRLAMVDDVGVVLDPALVAGQAAGSAMQGLGAALFEEMSYDGNGQPITSSFLDYLLPKADLDMHLVEARLEHASQTNPLGAKGAGEGGCIGVPAAVLNATIDALAPYGVKDLQIPLHPRKVWRAISEASAG